MEIRKAGTAELGDRGLSSRVIEAAIAVHTSPGPGFLESAYEAAGIRDGSILNLSSMPLAIKRIGPGGLVS